MVKILRRNERNETGETVLRLENKGKTGEGSQWERKS